MRAINNTFALLKPFAYTVKVICEREEIHTNEWEIVKLGKNKVKVENFYHKVKKKISEQNKWKLD